MSELAITTNLTRLNILLFSESVEYPQYMLEYHSIIRIASQEDELLVLGFHKL